MFWFNLAFMAIAGYAVLAIGIERTPRDGKGNNEKARQP
jgi:hypothetical protein